MQAQARARPPLDTCCWCTHRHAGCVRPLHCGLDAGRQLLLAVDEGTVNLRGEGRRACSGQGSLVSLLPFLLLPHGGASRNAGRGRRHAGSLSRRSRSRRRLPPCCCAVAHVGSYDTDVQVIEARSRRRARAGPGSARAGRRMCATPHAGATAASGGASHGCRRPVTVQRHRGREQRHGIGTRRAPVLAI
jgi:hypothetical protein